MIAIIGGGVIGLAIGWRLATAGRPVAVFEQGEIGSTTGGAASWAAAGMLAAVSEAEPEEANLLSLALAAQAIWPAFARELEAAAGQSIDYHRCGSLHIALKRDEVEQLRFLCGFLTGCNLDVQWLTAAAARDHAPYLTPDAKAALFSPGDAQVDNRKLVAALRRALLVAGGRLHENCAVTELESSGGRVSGVIADGQRHTAEAVVLAAGAWSGSLTAIPAPLRPPVRPLKGQMLSVRMQPQARLTKVNLWRNGFYLVPRLDGRLLVGATMEERGFESGTTAGGLFVLLENAREVLPGIDELPIEEIWSGFRPASRDDAPILGPAAMPGLVYATGHFRHGMLLTPVTADGIARYLLTGDLPAELAPFALDRFDAPRRRLGAAS